MSVSSQNKNEYQDKASELLSPLFQPISKNRTSRAREWKKSGGKVAGYLSNNIPLEIIHAAGFMPFHLIGDPQQSTPLADEFMEPAFDPITRSIFQKLLAGEYDYLDIIILPRCNDSQQRLYYYICEIHRKYPEYKLPPVFLIDLLHSPNSTSEKHNRIKFQEFFDFMSDFSGLKISGQTLTSSIKKYNLARDQLKELNTLRAKKSISSFISYSIYSAAFSLPVEEFIDGVALTLNNLKNNMDSRESLNIDSNAKRLIIVGNGLDHPSLHLLIDDLDAIVVGDYHSYGNHFLVGRIEENEDSIISLTDHYYKETKSSRSFFVNPDEIVDFSKKQNASGVIFFYIKKEEALSWHYPKQLKACERAGLNSEIFSDQSYQIDAIELSKKIKELIEKL